MKKLFLFDAFALIYRAHFAFSKNPLVNSKGLDTGAIRGFTNTILEVIEKEKPTHLGVAFDTHAPTFRHKEFPDYKAQREKQPEAMTLAIPDIKKILQAFQIPLLEKDGYEADDIIGTIAKKAVKKGFKVLMMTSDKDYGQLVEENILLYKPAYLGNAVETLGVKEILEKWQIKRVEQVIDMLGLQGDAVDNIEGIKGIGEKTAVKLIEQFDNIENLILPENIAKLSGKTKNLVEQGKEQALLSKKLATIDINVPEIEFDENEFLYRSFDVNILKPIFEDLEFKTLAQKLFGKTDTKESNITPTQSTSKKSKPKNETNQTDLFGATIAVEEVEIEEKSTSEETQVHQGKHTIESIKKQYFAIQTDEQLEELLHFLNKQTEFCFDTETTHLEAYEAELVGLSFSYRKDEGFYVPFQNSKSKIGFLPEKLELFKPIFENENIIKIGQNIKYDLMVLANYGLEIKGKMFDTMLAHYLIEPEKRHNMDILSETYLNYSPISIETLIGSKGKNQGNMADVSLSFIAEYAAEDADITFQLKQKLVSELSENKLEALFEHIEMPLIKVLAQMERNGIKIDIENLKDYSVLLQKDIEALEQEIYQLAGEIFNIASPLQLGKILFEKLKITEKPKKTATGQYATGEEILVKFANEFLIVRKILEIRELQKLKSTYIDALPNLISPKDSYIHTSYNQAVAATGRLSSNNPNLQNIPIRTEKGREIRKAFVSRSPEFTLLSADYSQIELRVMAHFAKDEAMKNAFANHIDIHSATASKIYKVDLQEVSSEMRRKAKTANFGIIYGISAFGLAERLNIPRKEAAQIIETYFAEFSAVKTYMDKTIEFARKNEFVETLLGRKRYIRDINSSNAVQRGYAERNAINTPIQGTAADLIKKAMIDIHEFLQTEKLQSKLLLQVHDELVFDVFLPEYEYVSQKVKTLMENAIQLDVPLLVEIGKGENWLVAH